MFMDSNLSAVDHLLLGREALLRQSRAIDEAVGAIDRVLTALALAPEATRAPVADKVIAGGDTIAPPVATPQGVPTVREAIVIALQRDGGAMKTSNIIAAVRRQGVEAVDDSVRSLLIKLLKTGRIERPRHGFYALAGQGRETGPTDAEAPVAPGASVVSAPTREEVTEHGTTSRDDHQDQGLRQNDPGGRSGASVERHSLVAL